MSITRHKTPIELVRPSFYRMLITYYIVVIFYGFLRTVFQSRALIEIQGQVYAYVWGCVVMAASFVAIIGVLFTRWYGRGWIEWGSSILLISALIGYAYASVAYGLSGVARAEAAIPNAALGFALSILPGWRVLVMSADGSVIFRKLRRAVEARG